MGAIGPRSGVRRHEYGINLICNDAENNRQGFRDNLNVDLLGSSLSEVLKEEKKSDHMLRLPRRCFPGFRTLKIS
jgi:hypothetical protein